METRKGAESLIDSADSLTDIIWKIANDGQITFSNKHWRAFSGDTAASGKARHIFPPDQSVHPDDIAKLTDSWRSAQEAATEFKLEVRIRRDTDKEYIWHLLRVWPVFSSGEIGPSGAEAAAAAPHTAPAHWLAICTDVHNLKTVQQMFQLVIDNIPVSIFWKDRDSVYLGCNRRFASQCGKESSESIIGTNDYSQPWSTEQTDFFIECDRRVMESGVPEYHIIEPQLRAEGEHAWLDTNKIPLLDAAGKVIGIIGMYEDITERVAFEQQKEDFVATLTHDLKNPLLGTNRVLDLLITGKLGAIEESQQQILSQIKESNISLLRMIHNLLDVYRYDSGKNSLKIDRVDINQLLNTAVERNQIASESKQIKLTLRTPTSVALTEACARSLGRVIQNLLDNALKFTPADGSITVDLRDLGNHWQIEVKDNGPGIDIDEQKQLFKRFWQGTPGKKYSHGTGLGLYLCKQIVEAHRGKIACESLPGHGSAFFVTLPKRLEAVT